MNDLFKTIFIFSIILTFFQTLLFAQDKNNSKEKPPNVVLILLDTLRPDHLGFYGFPKKTAGFLDKLAENSVVFKRAFSISSWTAPPDFFSLPNGYPLNSLLPRLANDIETHSQTIFYNIRVKGTVGKIIGDGYFRNNQPVSINIHDGFKQDIK